MVNVYKNYLLVFFLFFNITIAYSEEKIAFVDIDFLIQNSNIGKSALAKIKIEDEKNINILTKKTKELKDLENKIKNKKSILSPEAYENEVKLFKEKVNNYSNEKNTIVNSFNDFKKEEIDKIFKKITPIIKSYMDSNSIGILLDTKNIFMGNVNNNLTNEILKEINKSLN
jgi:outer membrane protein